MSFRVGAQLSGRHGRAGVIHTAHGDIHTPAFIAVATQALVKAVLPETMKVLGAQAVLGNVYHLYLQPGAEIVEEAGGFAAVMNWDGPTFTDSGGFQVLSLGAGFRKVLAMDVNRVQAQEQGDPGCDAGRDPQRALHHPAGGPDPGGDTSGPVR
jgi:queuine tRNA-ribosyltransferase